ncbi:MAG: hypothetical protein Q9174_000629 [Haloplaca sp. 1 TL-2023]
MSEQGKEAFGSFEDVLSYLTTIESSVENEVDRIAESIDAVTDRLSASLRSALGESVWLPRLRSPKPAPPPPYIARPMGYFEASRDWVSRHRAITAAVVCFLGTSAYLVWRQRRNHRMKRRAKRAKNGQRTEVVVLAGPPSAPLTRSLSLDLERRGFIVYIPVNSLGEERLIQAESKSDIRPLHVDITSVPILFLTSTNATSLSPPRLGLENVIAGGMEKYISTLRKELGSSQGVNTVHFKLGVFDDGSDLDALKMAVALRHENQSEDSSTTSTLPRNLRRLPGSPLRELHLEVFDAIVGKRKGIVHVGRGSRTYDYLGKVLPEGLAGWMLGLQAQREQRKNEMADAKPSDLHESPGWENIEQISEEESA